MRYGKARYLFPLALVAALTFSSVAPAAPEFETLVGQLATGKDFRVRVTAALRLGTSANPQARAPLERALEDDSEAVRVAALSALERLADTRCLAAVKRATTDKTVVVQKRAKKALAALEKVLAEEEKNSVHVEVEVSGDAAKGIQDRVREASTAELAQLPGVKLAAVKKGTVLLSARVKKVSVERGADGATVAARVEYLVQRLPDRTISSTMRGSAQGQADDATLRNRKRMETLERDVLLAAVRSALKNARRALLAARD